MWFAGHALRRHTGAALGLLLAGAVACTRTSDLSAPPASVSVPDEDSPPTATIALVDVNVVTMSGPTPLQHQTIIVRDGRVATLAPVARVTVPTNAFRIDGAGRLYVLPGLTDMHVHMFDRDEMILYLANGITTVRNMHGIMRHLAWRDSIARGELLGPRIYTSGPIIDGDPPTRSTNVVIRTPDEVRRVVDEQIDAGFDFIKIYDNVPLDLYRVLTAEARARGKIVVGHLPTPVGIDGIMEPNGQHGVEHAEELLPFFDDGRSDAGLATTARRFAQADIWLDATIDVYASALAQSQNWTALKARPEMAYVNPETSRTWGWEETARSRTGPGATQRFQRTTTFMTQRLIPEFRAGGVHLLAGSDAPIPALIPGFALLDELDLLRSAHLTPFEVLQTATTNPATFLGQAADLGPLTAGRLADLLVVDTNPLENLGALRRRRGVIVRGRWLSQVGLQRRLDSLATKYRAQ